MILQKHKFRLPLFTLLLMFTLGGFLSSCADDDADPPVITYPDNGMLWEVNTGELPPFEFTVVAEGGQSSSTIGVDILRD